MVNVERNVTKVTSLYREFFHHTKVAFVYKECSIYENNGEQNSLNTNTNFMHTVYY